MAFPPHTARAKTRSGSITLAAFFIRPIATGGEATGTATGTGVVYGGDGDEITMWAVDTATLSGSLYLNGGDSTDVAGDGGYVEICSMKAASVISAELITVAAGSGETSGDSGTIFIDGFDVSPLDDDSEVTPPDGTPE